MPEFWFRRCRLWLALAVVAPSLGACSGLSMPSLSSPFGGSSASAEATDSAAFAPANFECPGVTIRQGAGTMSVGGNEPTAMNLRYQLSLGETARECRVANGLVTMKVGVRGRVVLGPAAGGDGRVEVPIRFAVVREGVTPRTVTTKLQRVAVSIPPGDPSVMFSHVEDELTFSMPAPAEIDSYVVYVGFDALAAQEPERKRRPPPRTSRLRQDS
jgi:hypothetical protein